jgi:hypothetical protein
MARKKGSKDRKKRKKIIKVVRVVPQKNGDNYERRAEIRREISSANRTSQELRGWLNLGRRFL